MESSFNRHLKDMPHPLFTGWKSGCVMLGWDGSFSTPIGDFYGNTPVVRLVPCTASLIISNFAYYAHFSCKVSLKDTNNLVRFFP